MFSYPCPFCFQRLMAPPERAGQRTICPKCLRPIVIPPPEEPGAGSQEAVVDPTALPQVPQAEEVDDIPEPIPAAPAPAASRPARVGAAVATRRPEGANAITFAPSNLPTVDIAAELSAAISMRMKPPPEPPSDLRLSTGTWLLLSGAAVVLWLVGIFYESDAFPFVGGIGLFQIVAGYLWAAYMMTKKNLVTGIAGLLLPPIALVRMLRPFGENGYRPLRFVITGALILGLFAVGPLLQDKLRALLTPVDTSRTDSGPTTATLVEKLKGIEDRRQPDALIGQLTELARPDVVKVIPADTRADMVTELKRHVKAERVDVRAAALTALAAWAPAEARDPTLVALRSGEPTERKAALALASLWNDDAIAAAVAARLTDRQEAAQAWAALRGIGGTAAESALIPLLKSEDQLFVVSVITWLQEVGGAKGAVALKELSETGASETVRKEAGRAAEALSNKKK